MLPCTCSDCAVASMPRTLTLPASGTKRPAARRIKVVLPAASGPTSPVTTPWRMRKLTCCNAGTLCAPIWKVLEMPVTASAVLLAVSAEGVAVMPVAALTRTSGILAAIAVRQRRLVQRDAHRGRHALAQFVLRVAYEDAHLVDQAAAHLGGLHRFRRELGRRGDETYPAAVFLAGVAVGAHRRRHARLELAEILALHIGAYPQRVAQCQRIDRALRRGHVARFEQAPLDDAVVRRIERCVGQRLARDLQR